MSGFRARLSFRPRGRNHWLPGGGEADIPEGGAVGAASPLLPVSQHFFGLLYLEHLVEGDDAVDDLPHGDASLLFVLLCLPPKHIYSYIIIIVMGQAWGEETEGIKYFKNNYYLDSPIY